MSYGQDKVKRSRAEPFHLGRNTQVWDIRIRSENHDLLNVSRLTIAVTENQSLEK